MKTIAAFDFDGTMTKKDTFLDFAFFFRGRRKTLFALLRHSFSLFTKEKGAVKENIFHSLYKGLSYEEFSHLAHSYSLNRIPEILNPEMIQKIERHQSEGHEVIIISASIKEWIAPWAESIGIKTILSTEIETGFDGDSLVLTGRFSTPNCKGMEKINRLKAKYPNRDSYCLYSYGNSKDDLPLLDYSDHSYWI